MPAPRLAACPSARTAAAASAPRPTSAPAIRDSKASIARMVSAHIIFFFFAFCCSWKWGNVDDRRSSAKRYIPAKRAVNV